MIIAFSKCCLYICIKFNPMKLVILKASGKMIQYHNVML